MKTPRHPFECYLSVTPADICSALSAFGVTPWLDFWLNPRRLRGSDFLMRWSQGQWSEARLCDAVNATGEFFALPYGPNSVAPSGDPREFELYFERLDAAGLGQVKKPDLLIFAVADRPRVDLLVEELGGLLELSFIAEDAGPIRSLLATAKIAIECENSLWRAKKMPDFGMPMRPQKRLGGRPGLRKNAVLPTVIVKEEDREPLRAWQSAHRVPIHIWHVFFDAAYGLAFDEAERLIAAGLTEPIHQVFQAPGGAVTRKPIYKHYYHHGYPLADALTEPVLLPDCIEDKDGHILPYVRFSGGELRLTPEALAVLRESRA